MSVQAQVLDSTVYDKFVESLVLFTNDDAVAFASAADMDVEKFMFENDVNCDVTKAGDIVSLSKRFQHLGLADLQTRCGEFIDKALAYVAEKKQIESAVLDSVAGTTFTVALKG